MIGIMVRSNQPASRAEMRPDAPPDPAQGSFALEAAVWIMVALAEEPNHGYAIMKDIENLGGFSMRPGTLYAALARMERAGLVKEIQSSDYRRRPFRLTAAGRERLTGDVKILAVLAATGLQRLQRHRLGKKAA
jgi:DNA-binding PadR family transcriptional regulator